MTCVIGLVQDGVVYMGSDSAVSSGWEVRPLVGEKIFRLGDMLVGATGDHSQCQLVRYVKPSAQSIDTLDEEYLINVVLVDIRRCLKEHGVMKVEDNIEEMSGEILIAYHSRLYKVGIDCSLLELADGFDAIGSGREYALGAMLVLHGVAPEQRIELALKAAAYFCSSVCGPFIIRSIGEKA